MVVGIPVFLLLLAVILSVLLKMKTAEQLDEAKAEQGRTKG